MELYHVLNRGVEKRDIFMSNRDRVRFVNGMYVFNDTRPANNTAHALRQYPHNDVRRRYVDGRKQIVDIHAWCLMRNHYHLLLSARAEGGLTTFLRKLNGGYTKYFNEKYHRDGVLFQGKTKRVQIEREAHFLHIIHYIHLNPLDSLKGAMRWRVNNIQNPDKALSHLDEYRWSSYLDYCGMENFPSLINTEIFSETFPDYRKAVRVYIKEMDVGAIQNLILEEGQAQI